MKFDPFNWQEEQANAKIKVRKGRVRLHVSAPAPVYFEAEGVEALVGVGTAFDFTVSEPGFVTVAAEGVRVFRLGDPLTAFEAEGEVFTNIDRQPMESGMLADVLRAKRMFEIERREVLRELREARDAVRREKAAPEGEAAPAPAEAAPAPAEAAPEGEAVE